MANQQFRKINASKVQPTENNTPKDTNHVYLYTADYFRCQIGKLLP